MDYKIVWSDRSLTHLQDIIEYIAHDNPSAASKTAAVFVEKVSLLFRNPYLGRVYARLERDDVREIPIPPYRIFYQIVPERHVISVLAVWHGARQEPHL